MVAAITTPTIKQGLNQRPRLVTTNCSLLPFLDRRPSQAARYGPLV